MLTGAGAIQANGGNNCLPTSRLPPDSNFCTGSTSGAGGGWAASRHRPHRNAWTGHVTAIGGVNFDYLRRADIKGKSGTVWPSKAIKS